MCACVWWIWDGVEEGVFYKVCCVLWTFLVPDRSVLEDFFFLCFLSSSSVFVDWERMYVTVWMRDVLDLSFSLLFFTSSAIDFSPYTYIAILQIHGIHSRVD